MLRESTEITVKDVADFLETIAPLPLQEDYDNAGLLIGNENMLCKGAMISLDVTEEILQEAINCKVNLIIAHHPVIFRGLKKINGTNYTERIVMTAIKNDIAVYAAHTNLDNIIQGVNGKIAEKLGLRNIRVLQQKESQLKKLVTFAPPENADAVREAIFKAGAGHIGNYSECSFTVEGISSFKPEKGANPKVGAIGIREEGKEIKLEFIFQPYREANILAAMKAAHAYEEVAYDIISLGNYLSDTGSGVLGEIEEDTDPIEFLKNLAEVFKVKCVKHSQISNKRVKTIAVCGGAGSFLISAAKRSGADIFITSDLKYHDFFEGYGQLTLVDIGHFESEQYTTDLIFELLSGKFPKFALLKTGLNTNPVQYFIP